MDRYVPIHIASKIGCIPDSQTLPTIVLVVVSHYIPITCSGEFPSVIWNGSFYTPIKHFCSPETLRPHYMYSDDIPIVSP